MMFVAHTTTDAISAGGGVPLHHMTVVLEGDSIELDRDFGSWLETHRPVRSGCANLKLEYSDSLDLISLFAGSSPPQPCFVQ